jgi:DNA-binding NarL/FixJ family response regulator
MEMPLPLSLPLQLLVVDDEELVREGLVQLFEKSPHVDVDAAAATPEDVIEAAAERTANIALVDVCHGVVDSWNGIGTLQKTFADIRLVVLDDVVRDVHLRRVLRLGVHGYATKGDSFQALYEIVRAVGHGEQRFSPKALERLVSTPFGWQLSTSDDAPGLHLLTVRETEVLVCLAQGHTARICGELLKISSSTVDNHKAKIMKKLKIHRMIDLAKFAVREGLVPR